MPLDNKIDFEKEKRSMRAQDMVFNVGAVYILMVLNITNILSNGVISNKNILHQMATKQIASNGVFQQFKFFLLFSNNSERDTYGIS